METVLKMMEENKKYSEQLNEDLKEYSGWKRPSPNGLNMILEKDGWYLSYNNAPNLNCDNKAETAIMIANESHCFILYGDFRREFENYTLIQALKRFIELYDELAGFWTTGKDKAEEILSSLEVQND